jgi:hypothetical protein
MPTSRSTIGTIGRNSGWVRKNSFFVGVLPTEIVTMPAALAPFAPGRSRRIDRNSASSSSSCSATFPFCWSSPSVSSVLSGLVSTDFATSVSDSPTSLGLSFIMMRILSSGRGARRANLGRVTHHLYWFCQKVILTTFADLREVSGYQVLSEAFSPPWLRRPRASLRLLTLQASDFYRFSLRAPCQSRASAQLGAGPVSSAL